MQPETAFSIPANEADGSEVWDEVEGGGKAGEGVSYVKSKFFSGQLASYNQRRIA
jgi:hypothetical protein